MLVLVRQEYLAGPSGVIVLVACFVDLRLMTVATRCVHRPLAHPGPVITSCFFLHFIIEQTVCWEEGAPACRLPSLSFYCAALWESLIYWPENRPSTVCVWCVWKLFIRVKVHYFCCASAILHLLERQSARNAKLKVI